MQIDESIAIAEALKHFSKWEGGLDDDPRDPGGITNFGLDLRDLQDFAKKQENRDFLERIGIILPVTRETIINLTRDQSHTYYKYTCWQRPRAREFGPLVAIAFFDHAANGGPSASTKILQRTLGFAEKEVDGIPGPMTRRAILQQPQRAFALKAVAMRRKWYIDLATEKPEKFRWALKGWLNRTDDLRNTLVSLADKWGIV